MGSQETRSRLGKVRGLMGAGDCKQAADSSLAGQGDLPYKPSSPSGSQSFPSRPLWPEASKGPGWGGRSQLPTPEPTLPPLAA